MKKYFYIFYFFVFTLLISISSKAQIITTVAGNGTSGYNGDGDLATSAAVELNFPSGVAVDNSNNIYIADISNNRIRKVNTSGIITTIAGNGTSSYSGDGGPAISAELNNPNGVAVDNSGNVYIADGGNNRIRKVNTSGIISTIAGNTGSSYTGDGVPATLAGLSNPQGVAVDNSGNIYIADNYSNRVRKVNTSGIITTIAGNGMNGYTGDGGPATLAELSYAYGVAVDNSGNVYIADELNQAIRKINTFGIITTLVGPTALILNPFGVAVDNSDNVYVPGGSFNTVLKINASGVIVTIAGNDTAGYTGDGGLATAAELNSPEGVCADNSGNVYIADAGNSVIRKIYNSTTEVSNVTNLSSLKVFPNPTQNEITISSNTLISNVIIMNIIGLTIYSFNFNTDKVQLNIADLPTGMYYIRINGAEVRRFEKR